MARQGFDLQLTRHDERGLARDVLHERDGTLADERDGHRVGAHALARDATGGVGCTHAERSASKSGAARTAGQDPQLQLKLGSLTYAQDGPAGRPAAP